MKALSPAEQDRYDAKLEKISELLELAKSIVAELETGATAETETDVDHAISEAKVLARTLAEDSQ